MRLIRTLIAGALLVSGVAANATTVVITIDPMTLDHYTQVINSPGPDHAIMCMAPPAEPNCREVPFQRR